MEVMLSGRQMIAFSIVHPGPGDNVSAREKSSQLTCGPVIVCRCCAEEAVAFGWEINQSLDRPDLQDEMHCEDCGIELYSDQHYVASQ